VGHIVDRFYQRLLTDPESRAVFTGGEAQIAHQRELLSEWLNLLLAGRFDRVFFKKVFRVGVSHVRAAVPQHLMVTGIEIVQQEITAVLESSAKPTDVAEQRAMEKLLALNLAAMLESYKDSYETAIRRDERSSVEEKLTRAEHLAEIGQLAASLAHEIKNPLAGISGAIQIIRGSMTPEDPHRPILAEVLGQIKRLDATVKDLLQYARPVPPRLKRCTIGTVIDRVIAVLREEPALQNVCVEHNGIPSNAVIMADENQIEQLLMNLIINAAHASRDGDHIKVGATVQSECVNLTVVDSGGGMPDDVRAEAFEPFFTTKAKGTGLGLSICRRIVEAHGGTIGIKSAPGVGTTVTIQISRSGIPLSDGGSQ